jgi:hypothetical protein
MKMLLTEIRDAMARQFAQVKTISIEEATAYIDSQLDYARTIYRAAGAPFGDDDAGLVCYLTDTSPDAT